jgi:hypothetical protein
MHGKTTIKTFLISKRCHDTTIEESDLTGFVLLYAMAEVK